MAILFCLNSFAQDYTWQWATRGGGIKNAPGDAPNAYLFSSEQVHDIVVDADNNYYFLTFMTQQDTEYDGLPITVYNAPNANSGGIDLVLVSTNCEGELRWTQTIGGSGNDFGYKIALDNAGGLYLTANLMNISGPGQSHVPPHFAPGVALPVFDGTAESQEARKTAALIKYSTEDGSLEWYKMLQGEVSNANFSSIVGNIVVDSEGNLRVLVGLLNGTHLDGLVTVPDTFTNTAKFFIVTVSPEGEYLNVTDLPMEGVFEQSQTQFKYDETLQRYYIAGFRTYPGNSTLIPLSYNGVPFESCSFILAIDEQGDEIWRLEENRTPPSNSTRLYDLVVDEDSNFYICGVYNNNGGAVTTFSNYTFPPVPGIVAYVLKLSPDGTVLWGSTPDTETSINFPQGIAINGDEIAVATEMFQQTWDEVSIDRGQNYLSDPVLLRINKETGVAFALHDVLGTSGNVDSFTAVAADNDGNYIAGGYFRNQIFLADDDNIETLSKVGGQQSYTDFFIAKLGAVACGEGGTASVDTPVKPGLKVYPNPAFDELMFESPQAVTSFTVSNLLGQTLLAGELQAGQYQISLQGLSPGTYLVSFTTATGNKLTEKIVKK